MALRLVQGKSEIHGFRIVTLDSPTACWSQPLARRIFEQVIGIKLAGYLSAHRAGTLPLDTTDFVCTHHLVCESDTLRPLMAYKTVSLERCKQHNLAFPAIAVLRSSGVGGEHERAALSIVRECEENGVALDYGSSWTVDPEARKDRELARTLRDLLTATLLLHYRDTGVCRFMACGVPKFKTDQFFLSIGYELLKSGNGADLPSFAQASLMGEHAVMVQGRQFTPEALAVAQGFTDLWDQRLRIIPDPANIEKIAA